MENTEPKVKTLRRNNPEYQEIKVHKASYKDGMKRLFLALPNWKSLSRAAGILNVPTMLDDRLRMQADLKRRFQHA